MSSTAANATTQPSVSDTPLEQWAIEANRWDGIDPIPQEDEPVFYADLPAGIQTERMLPREKRRKTKICPGESSVCGVCRS